MDIYFCALLDWTGLTTIYGELYPSVHNAFYICPSLKPRASVIFANLSDNQIISIAVPNTELILVEDQKIVYRHERVRYATTILLPLIHARRASGMEW